MDLEWSSPQQSSSIQQRAGSQRNDENHSGTAFEQMGFAGGSNGFFGVPGADTDAELEAILSNYQPKVNAPTRLPAEQLLQDGRRMSTTRSSQPAADNMNPATAAAAAAAAAYGHLGYGGVGGTGHGRAIANWSAVPLNSSGPPQGIGGGGGGVSAGNLNIFGIGSQPYTDASSISNRVSSQPDISPMVQVDRVSGTGGGGSGAGAGGGYEGDASNSNTSSAHTPAEMSSGTDDNGSGKRRRVTMSAGESLPGLQAPSLVNVSPRNNFRLQHQEQQQQQQQQLLLQQQLFQQQQQQQQFDPSNAATSLNSFSGGPVHGFSNHRPNFTQHPSSTVNSALMEEMAAAGLRRASEDNKRVFNHGLGPMGNHSHLYNQSEISSSASPPPMSSLLTTNNSGHPVRPPYRHRRSHSGSAAISSSGSFFGPAGGNDDGASGSRLGLSTTKRLSHGSSTFGIGGGGSGPQMTGHAASHPPGLGSQVLRGADGTASGTNAATDFTKRKGWSNRIVEELLDFVHVLDAQGRLLFATPSVQTLTGWRPEELKGRALADFIHPDDVSAVMRELNTAMQERSELTMFYRFRKRPQSAADKQRIQEKRDANHVDLSQSESSGTDSSSAPKTGITSGSNGVIRRPSLPNQDQDDDEDVASFLDDQEDRYVIFEATGHPYYPPDGAGGVSVVEATGDSSEVGSIQGVKQEFGSPNKQRTARNPGDDGMKDEIGRRGSEQESKSESAMQCFFCSCRVYPTKNVGMLDSFLELKLENERLRLLLSELSVSETPTNPLKQQHTGGGASSTEAASEGRRSLDEGAHAYNPDYRSFDADGTPHFPSYAQMQPFHGRDSISSIPNLASAPTSPIVGQSLEGSLTKDTAGPEESDDARSPASGAADEDGKRKKVNFP